MNKLVYGIGINDIKNSSKTKMYYVWHSILERCYNKSFHMRKTTYKDCEIDIRWQRLSEFKKWFDINYIEDYVLDKDVFIPNNKIYSPDICLFLPNSINKLIVQQTGKGYAKTAFDTYQVKVSVNGKRISLGNYKNKDEAHKIYIEFKANRYIDIADEWWDKDEKIATGLYRHAENLLGNDWKITLP